MTTKVLETSPSQVGEIFQETRRLAAMERLILAKLLLESVLSDELDANVDWSAMELEAFQRDGDNKEDAVYDYPLAGEWDETEWLQAAVRNPAFDFLQGPEEDIYSLSDGKPFHDKV